MSYKTWDEHSPRWKREHIAAGESRAKWNRFLKLSDKSRKSADIRQYAKGVSVATQTKAAKQRTVVQKITATLAGRTHITERAVSGMTADEIRWTLKASPEQIRARAGAAGFRKDGSIWGNTKYIRNGRNIWWYHND